MDEFRDPYKDHIDTIRDWYEFLEVLDAWDDTTSRYWDTEPAPAINSLSGRYSWWATILAKWILANSNVDPEPLLQITRMIQAKDPLGEWTAFAATPAEIERRRYEWRPYRQMLVDLAMENQQVHAVVSCKIPAEFRTRAMTYKDAARYLGRPNPDSGVKWLKQCIEDDTVSCEHLSARAHVFDVREFPPNVQKSILPR